MRKIYLYPKVLLVLFIGFTGSKAGDSFFDYYNGDVIVQSAFIRDGFNIEYSLPDLSTLSHLRLTYEINNVVALHGGIGYPEFDIGFSSHLFNWKENSVRILLGGGASAVKGPIFIFMQLTSSLSRNYKSEYGFSFSSGYNVHAMMEIDWGNSTSEKILEEYSSKFHPELYFKQEIYYIFKMTEMTNLGIGTGITEGIYLDNSITILRFQLGISLKQYF